MAEHEPRRGPRPQRRRLDGRRHHPGRRGGRLLAVASPAPLFWFVIGASSASLGAVTGKVLGMAGYGAKDVPEPEADREASGVR